MEDGKHDHERKSNIPHRETSGHNCHETFARVLAEIARAECELRSRQEQDNPQNLTRDHAKDRLNRAAEEETEQDQHGAENDHRSTCARSKSNVTSHPARAVAHWYATDRRPEEVHQSGRN